jgi:D-alanyl-D-alanine carboxypeptidase/D-alanyl-D-alanine-endopeptidase (penicillin-binding protein 4)
LSRKTGFETAALSALNEGAGLSRQNRVTVRETLELLSAFKPYAYLLRKRDGTLLKTGTMRGVYNYAGYLDNGNPFAVLLNQPNNNRRAVLKELEKMVIGFDTNIATMR